MNTPKLPDIVITMLHKYVPIIVGFVITWATKNFGIDLTQFSQQWQEAIFVTLSLAAMTAWYLGWRLLAKYYPTLAWLVGYPAFPEKYVSAKEHAEYRIQSQKMF